MDVHLGCLYRRPRREHQHLDRWSTLVNDSLSNPPRWPIFHSFCACKLSAIRMWFGGLRWSFLFGTVTSGSSSTRTSNGWSFFPTNRSVTHSWHNECVEWSAGEDELRESVGDCEELRSVVHRRGPDVRREDRLQMWAARVRTYANDVEIGWITLHDIVAFDDFEVRDIGTLKHSAEIIRSSEGRIITGKLNNELYQTQSPTRWRLSQRDEILPSWIALVW